MHRLIFLISILTCINAYSQKAEHVFVFLNSKPDKEKISVEDEEALQAQHMKSIEELVKAEKMIVAGPFDGGGGIFILNTGSKAKAWQWLQNDPAVRAERWDIELFPVHFNKGSACLVQPPYEMVSYNFIRVKYINDIANYKMNESLEEKWNNLSQQDSVIMVAIFPQSDGGVIVSNAISSTYLDESLNTDQLLAEKKKLWIARGAFCE